MTWDALKKEGVRPEQVSRIYTELQPCSGLPGGSCSTVLKENFPHAEVSYSFEYGVTKASRQSGKEGLLTALAREQQAKVIQ